MPGRRNRVPTSGKTAELQRRRRVRYGKTTHRVGKTTTTGRDRLQMDIMFPAHRNTVSRPSSRAKDGKEMVLRAKWKRGVDRTSPIERSNLQ
jgi:hypothetical protein